MLGPAARRHRGGVDALYALKPWYSRRLQALVDLAVTRRISPDAFTAAGVAAAAVAAAAIAAGAWPLAALALAARLAGANLDGAVARARDVSRPWGCVLNEVGDRLSDLLAFAGLVVLAWRVAEEPAAVPMALVAAIAASLPTLASLAVAAAGGARRNGGPVGKTERCLLLVVAAAVPAWIVPVCAAITAGSVVTAALRLSAGRRELEGRR